MKHLQRSALAAAAALLLAYGAPARAAGFASPDAAADALVAAARSGDAQAIEHVLGPGSTPLVESGDPVADRADRAKFLEAYDAKHRIERGNGIATIMVGTDEVPLPIPLREARGRWSYDTRAAADAILDRRIGRNELAAIETVRAIADAERDYANAGSGEYAAHLMSSPGKKDGLYWPAAAGTPQSPLGPLVATARAQGYGGHHDPYHGYYFKLLAAQGPNAADGARGYVVRGRMIGGFAVEAYPAKWGSSGVMTFIVNQDGVVHQKNLGAATTRDAARILRYDPDPSWKPLAQ